MTNSQNAYEDKNRVTQKNSYKILMIAPRPFYVDHGFSVQIREEYKGLQQLGNDIILCCYHVGEEVEGIKISRSFQVPWYKDPTRSVSFHYLYLDFLLLLNVFKTAFKSKPDVIHAHIHEGGLIGVIVGKLLRIPVILDIQGSMLGEYKERGLPSNFIIEKIISFIENNVNRFSDALMVEVEHRKEQLLKNQHIKRDNIYLFKLGIDTDLFSPSGKNPDLLKKLKIPSDRKIIGYVGLLTPYQGIDLLLDAMKQILQIRNDVHLLLMGFLNEELYKKKAVELGLTDFITFTGKMPYTEAPKHLALCEIAVGPKISLQETNGKLIPYMSMGLPTVAFDTEMNREYLGEFGVYAKYKDSNDLARCILLLLDSEGKRKESSPKIRVRAIEKFGLANMAKNTMVMYDAVIKKYQGK